VPVDLTLQGAAPGPAVDPGTGARTHPDSGSRHRAQWLPPLRTVQRALDAVLRRHHALTAHLDPAGDLVMVGAGQHEQSGREQAVAGVDPHRPTNPP